jgi:hypothetical protein
VALHNFLLGFKDKNFSAFAEAILNKKESEFEKSYSLRANSKVNENLNFLAKITYGPKKVKDENSKEITVQAVDAELDMKSLYEEFTELLDKYDHNFKRGDMITGTVFRTDERGAYVDIGAKTAGYCSSTECSLRSDVKVSTLHLISLLLISNVKLLATITSLTRDL